MTSVIDQSRLAQELEDYKYHLLRAEQDGSSNPTETWGALLAVPGQDPVYKSLDALLYRTDIGVQPTDLTNLKLVADEGELEYAREAGATLAGAELQAAIAKVDSLMPQFAAVLADQIGGDYAEVVQLAAGHWAVESSGGEKMDVVVITPNSDIEGDAGSVALQKYYRGSQHGVDIGWKPSVDDAWSPTPAKDFNLHSLGVSVIAELFFHERESEEIRKMFDEAVLDLPALTAESTFHLNDPADIDRQGQAVTLQSHYYGASEVETQKMRIEMSDESFKWSVSVDSYQAGTGALMKLNAAELSERHASLADAIEAGTELAKAQLEAAKAGQAIGHGPLLITNVAIKGAQAVLDIKVAGKRFEAVATMNANNEVTGFAVDTRPNGPFAAVQALGQLVPEAPRLFVDQVNAAVRVRVAEQARAKTSKSRDDGR